MGKGEEGFWAFLYKKSERTAKTMGRRRVLAREKPVF
jgi:hypothetical protein